MIPLPLWEGVGGGCIFKILINAFFIVLLLRQYCTNLILKCNLIFNNL